MSDLLGHKAGFGSTYIATVVFAFLSIHCMVLLQGYAPWHHSSGIKPSSPPITSLGIHCLICLIEWK